MPKRIRPALFALLLSVLPLAVFAQGTQIALGGMRQDSSAPIEIAADQLKLDQASGAATFTGNVVIGQGELKLSAGEVVVEYLAGSDADGKISRLIATGDVLLVTATEAAEAQSAVYSVATGQIVLSGDVVLTQGANALSGQKVTINLSDGSALVEGRVTTTLQTGGSGKAP